MAARLSGLQITDMGRFVMRSAWFGIGFCIALFVPAFAASAGDTLRVDGQLLVTGDSTARVEELLGRPSHASHRSSSRSRRRGSASTSGERWQYRRDGRTITLTIVDDRVANIEQGNY
jgi:hypothetical protein